MADANPNFTVAPWAASGAAIAAAAAARRERRAGGAASAAGARGASFAPPPPPPAAAHGRARALGWGGYFDDRMTVEARGAAFRVFEARSRGAEGVAFVCCHGAGHAALTWACAALELRKHGRVLAVDMRGHGETREVPGEAPLELTIETLAADFAAVAAVATLESERVVLVGHSLGGAVVVRAAAALGRAAGVAVVDVVEGTALAALGAASKAHRSWPARFDSEADAVAWVLKAGVSRNPAAAAVAVPARLHRVRSGDGEAVVWRTNLAATEMHWHGWFEGLSSAFLGLRCAKLLLLAGTDTLDTELMVGQMQGRFQLVVLPDAGHAIQEDAPEAVAAALAAFASRLAGVPAFSHRSLDETARR